MYYTCIASATNAITLASFVDFNLLVQYIQLYTLQLDVILLQVSARVSTLIQVGLYEIVTMF